MGDDTVAEDTDGEPRGARVVTRDLTRLFTTGSGTVTAVNSVNLVVDAGQSVALVGTSGSGKSTLLHLIGAIESPTRGMVSVDDTVVTDLRGSKLAAYRRTIGFVFQRFHLLPTLGALDNVIAPLIPFRPRTRLVERGMELLAAVGLADRAKDLPSRLSGGQQQRVAIARALIGRPRLLLADEPTGNLDSATGAEILALLMQLNSDRGMTLLVATHDESHAKACDRQITIADGTIT